jgi:hypothetical protein
MSKVRAIIEQIKLELVEEKKKRYIPDKGEMALCNDALAELDNSDKMIADLQAENKQQQDFMDLAKEQMDSLSAKNQRLQTAIDEIERASCGEDQVAENDTDGMHWIYKRIQELKVGE